MKEFIVKFELVNGSTKVYKLKRENYNQVASEIMHSKDGWFGIKGDIVNLSNVLSARIAEKSKPTKDGTHAMSQEELMEWL